MKETHHEVNQLPQVPKLLSGKTCNSPDLHVNKFQAVELSVCTISAHMYGPLPRQQHSSVVGVRLCCDDLNRQRLQVCRDANDVN